MLKGNPGGQPGNDNAAKDHIPRAKIDELVKRLRRTFVGKTTSDGAIINNVDVHVAIQMIKRNIRMESVRNATFFGKRLNGNRKGSCIYEANGTGVIFVVKSGIIKSVIYKGKGGWK